MTSKAYILPETALQWLNTGGDELLTLTSVAAAAGRQGALALVSGLIVWLGHMEQKLSSGPVTLVINHAEFS